MIACLKRLFVAHRGSTVTLVPYSFVQFVTLRLTIRAIPLDVDKVRLDDRCGKYV